MTSLNLSENTRTLINTASSQGAGVNNINFVNAYNAIYGDLVANGRVDSGVEYWFSQAGNINGQAFKPSASGTYIWNFTKGAAASEGAIVTDADLQAASNKIAFTVLADLQLANFVFDDAQAFSMKAIVEKDAGAGIKIIKDRHLDANLDNAIWAGSLFARTQLRDPTYFTDYNLSLVSGSRACNALLSGLAQSVGASIGSAGTISSAIGSIFKIDYDAIGACLVKSDDGPVAINNLSFDHFADGSIKLSADNILNSPYKYFSADLDSNNLLDRITQIKVDDSQEIRTFDQTHAGALSEVKSIQQDSSYSIWKNDFSGGAIKATSIAYTKTGALARSVILNKDNRVVVSQYGLVGGGYRQDLYDNSGRLSGSVINRVDGSKINIVWNTGGGMVWADETEVSATGAVLSQTRYNKDGSYLRRNADGTLNYSASQGHLILNGEVANNQAKNAFSNAEYSKYVQAIALTLATQFSRLLFSNNLPAALAAGAFAGAAINTAFGTNTYVYNGTRLTEAQAFVVSFGVMLAGAAGGVVGAELGKDLFEAIGLPTNIGATLGGLVGSTGAQYLATMVAEDFNIIASESTSFFGSLEGGGVSTAGSYLGNELSLLVIGNGGIESQIGGAVGSTIGAVAGSSVLPGVGTFIGSFIGDFLGSVFGSLFGGAPSIGPNAVAQMDYSFTQKKFIVDAWAGDNGGDPEIPHSMALAEIDKENRILAAIGGTIDVRVSEMKHSLGFYKGGFFYAVGAVSPDDFPNKFGDAEAAVEFSILNTFREIGITGGNQYMKLAIQRSNAISLTGFLTDLNAASDYSLYIKNPLAFDVALASSGSEAAWVNWNAELAHVQSLGLDSYAHGTLVTAAPVTNLFASVSNVVINGNVSGSEVITPLAGNTFNLILAAGLDASKLRFSRTGNDLLLTFFKNGHTTTIKNWYAGTSPLLQSLVMVDGSGIGSNVIATVIANDPLIAAAISGTLAAQGATLSESRADFFATGRTSKILQASNRRIGVVQFDAGNVLTSRLWLTDAGASAVLATGASFIGSGQRFFGSGNDLLIRTGGGELQNWEFSSTGAVSKKTAMTALSVTGRTINLFSGAALVVTGNNNTINLAGTAALTVSGNNLLIGDATANTITGGSGNDTIDGRGGSDTLRGGAGNDRIVFNAQASIIDGGLGSDTLALNQTVATVVNLTLGNQLVGSPSTIGFENVDGATSTAALTLTGDAGANILNSGAGDDALTGGDGADAINGGLGTNNVYYTDSGSAIYISLDANGLNTDTRASFAKGDRLTNIARIFGSNAGNAILNNNVSRSIIGGASGDILTAGAGSDSLSGAGGNDMLTGGTDSNNLYGGDGNDVLNGGGGSDAQYGENGDDTITYDAADSIINGGAGNDTLILKQTAATSANLGLGNQVTSTAATTGFENIDGSASTAALTLTGDAGANVLRGGSAVDGIFGGDGDDWLLGGNGGDTIDGGLGTNNLYYTDSSAPIYLKLDATGLNTDTRASFAKGDKMINIARIFANDAGDIIINNNASRTLIGGAGADTLTAGAGSDSLSGAAGNDTLTGGINGNALYGGDGNDVLSGGGGNDILDGGMGNDTYLFARGNGADVLSENDATLGNKDVLKFSTGVNVDQLWFKMLGNTLEVDVIGTADSVSIDSWNLGTSRQVESIQAGGLELTHTRVINLVNAMAAMAPPAFGATVLSAAQHSALDAVIAANWRPPV